MQPLPKETPEAWQARLAMIDKEKFNFDLTTTPAISFTNIDAASREDPLKVPTIHPMAGATRGYFSNAQPRDTPMQVDTEEVVSQNEMEIELSAPNQAKDRVDSSAPHSADLQRIKKTMLMLKPIILDQGTSSINEFLHGDPSYLGKSFTEMGFFFEARENDQRCRGRTPLEGEILLNKIYLQRDNKKCHFANKKVELLRKDSLNLYKKKTFAQRVAKMEEEMNCFKNEYAERAKKYNIQFEEMNYKNMIKCFNHFILRQQRIAAITLVHCQL